MRAGRLVVILVAVAGWLAAAAVPARAACMGGRADPLEAVIAGTGPGAEAFRLEVRAWPFQVDDDAADAVGSNPFVDSEMGSPELFTIGSGSCGIKNGPPVEVVDDDVSIME